MELLIGIGGLVLVLVLVVAFVLSRMRVVGQTHAMLIAGAKGTDSATKVVKPGGRAFIVPVIQSASLIPLGQMNVPLSVGGVDNNKISIEVSAVAMVKVNQEDHSIRAAAERFGSAGQHFEQEVIKNLQQVLTGSLRSAIASMTVEELLLKRETLAASVKASTDAEVAVMGITVDSLQVLDIQDKDGYIKALGAKESEKVKADARVAIAGNSQRARDAEVTSEQAIAERDRDLALRRAELKGEQDTASALAAAAGPLAKAERDREIARLEQETARERAELREQELDAEVRRPADARRYQLEQEAEASKAEALRRAEASSEAVRLAAAADAEAIRLRGAADAEAIQAKGLADAEAMSKRAEALDKYGEAAKFEMLVERLPEMARSMAEPMGNIDKLTIISSDGASAIPKSVGTNLAALDETVEGLTGTSFSRFLGSGILSAPIGGVAAAKPEAPEESAQAQAG